MNRKPPKPVGVLITDDHYNLNTLEVADEALRKAIAAANYLDVPLVSLGDLHDTKANLRGECIAAITRTTRTANKLPIYLVGNHDLLNEQSKEHSLEFIRPFVSLIDTPKTLYLGNTKVRFIPYCSTREEAIKELAASDTNKIIMHQGYDMADGGHYYTDHSALKSIDIDGYDIISGHYHKRQTHKLHRGKISFLGNPYTLNFGEADHPEKGYHILYEDFSTLFVPLELRKHVVVEVTAASIGRQLQLVRPFTKQDLVWAKITGTREELAALDRTGVVLSLGLPSNARIDLIQVGVVSDVKQLDKSETDGELLDRTIDKVSSLTAEAKTRVKTLWKELL